MTDLEKLKERLQEVMQNKAQESAMASVIGINCKVPNQLQGFLTDFLGLTSDEVELVEQLYKLEPNQITILATLAMLTNGRVADFVRLERNMIVLKLSVVNYIQDNVDYRKTSIDENEDNPEAMLDALIKMKQIIKNSLKHE